VEYHSIGIATSVTHGMGVWTIQDYLLLFMMGEYSLQICRDLVKLNIYDLEFAKVREKRTAM
jgi:hypothetical protein